MAKTKQVTAVTQAAQNAAGALSAWGAVEARAKSILAATEAQEAGTGSFAEIHFSNGSVRGVIKAGDVVIKLEG